MLHLTFWGQACFCLENDGTRLVTDPYLSDYVDRTCSDDKVTWERAYPPPCTLADLKPDLVLVSPRSRRSSGSWTLGPYYAGGAVPPILPSRSPPQKPPVPQGIPQRALASRKSGSAYFGREFFRFANPLRAYGASSGRTRQYRELSYLISCGGKTVFFGGDLSLYDGLTERLADVRPDVMLLPVNGRDYYRTAAGIIGNTDCREAAELAKRCGASCLIPMHHDLYAVNGCRGAMDPRCSGRRRCFCPDPSLRGTGCTILMVGP